MLKLRYILIITNLLILTITLLVIFRGISSWWYLLPGIILIFFTILGSFNIRLSYYFNVICNIKSKDDIVITFDDGPDPSVTPKVLDVLHKNNVKATFFIIGYKAQQYPGLVRQIYNDGHIIGNHSWCHKNCYDFFSSKRIGQDLKKSGDEIKKIIGVQPKFFRPPFGVTNPNIKRAVKKTKLIPVGWSLRSLDTMNQDISKLNKRLSKVKPGDIVLFHDHIEGIDIVVDNFIGSCRQQQLKFARLDVALNCNAYE